MPQILSKKKKTISQSILWVHLPLMLKLENIIKKIIGKPHLEHKSNNPTQVLAK